MLYVEYVRGYFICWAHLALILIHSIGVKAFLIFSILYMDF